MQHGVRFPLLCHQETWRSWDATHLGGTLRFLLSVQGRCPALQLADQGERGSRYHVYSWLLPLASSPAGPFSSLFSSEPGTMGWVCTPSQSSGPGWPHLASR